MWKVIISIVEKLACKHEWEILLQKDVEKNDQWGRHLPQTHFLMKCTKCGKLKKMKI